MPEPDSDASAPPPKPESGPGFEVRERTLARRFGLAAVSLVFLAVALLALRLAFGPTDATPQRTDDRREAISTVEPIPDLAPDVAAAPPATTARGAVAPPESGNAPHAIMAAIRDDQAETAGSGHVQAPQPSRPPTGIANVNAAIGSPDTPPDSVTTGLAQATTDTGPVPTDGEPGAPTDADPSPVAAGPESNSVRDTSPATDRQAVDDATASSTRAAPAGAAQPESGPASRHVARAQLTSDVVDLEPVDNLGGVVPADLPGGRVLYFAELRNLAGRHVVHRWERGGRVESEVIIRPRGPRWRSYSFKNLDADAVGPWRVTIVADDGTLLSARNLEIVAD